jgi:hypothetical protein
MNSDEMKLAQGFAQELTQEIERLDGLMDEMITEMERTPPAERSGEKWDAFTKRFLELQAAQQAVGQRLRLANIALANADEKGTKQ